MIILAWLGLICCWFLGVPVFIYMLEDYHDYLECVYWWASVTAMLSLFAAFIAFVHVCITYITSGG